jgi:hypothetical protein
MNFVCSDGLTSPLTQSRTGSRRRDRFARSAAPVHSARLKWRLATDSRTAHLRWSARFPTQGGRVERSQSCCASFARMSWSRAGYRGGPSPLSFVGWHERRTRLSVGPRNHHSDQHCDLIGDRAQRRPHLPLRSGALRTIPMRISFCTDFASLPCRLIKVALYRGQQIQR